MSRLPVPNAALLKSAGKIRELEAEIETWKEFARYVGRRVQAPVPADFRERGTMLEYQREIAITLAAFLTDANIVHGPEALLTWLREEITEPRYELEPGYEVEQ